MKKKIFFWFNFVGILILMILVFLFLAQKMASNEIVESVDIKGKLKKQVKSDKNLKTAEENSVKIVENIYKAKFFVPYRGLGVIGPDGEKMPTVSAPKNLALVGITILGGQKGAMIIVPERRRLDKAEVLKRLRQFGDSEWATWMVNKYMKRGQRRSNIKIEETDKETAEKWNRIMDEIFTDLEYNKRFFQIGDVVYENFVLKSLQSDGVTLMNGKQNFFLAMDYSSRKAVSRIRKFNNKHRWNHYSALWKLYRQRWIIVNRNRRLNIFTKRYNQTRKRIGALYKVGSGESPKW